MHNPHQTESFVIQVRGSEASEAVSSSSRSKFNLSAMKLFHRFRKILMRLIFSVPSPADAAASSRHRNSDRFDPPKTSCSSYYSSYSHYNEAIADCIEFFNKSAQDGFLDASQSDVVWFTYSSCFIVPTILLLFLLSAWHTVIGCIWDCIIGCIFYLYTRHFFCLDEEDLELCLLWNLLTTVVHWGMLEYLSSNVSLWTYVMIWNFKSWWIYM